MKPFEIEVFDRNLNFRSNTLIDADSFQYSFDMLTKINNVLTLPAAGISIREDPSSGSAGDETIGLSDYIRISTNDITFEGVVKKLEKDGDFLTVTYTDLVHLFDHEVFTDPLEVTQTSIENYIAKLLRLSFVDNPDSSQEIPGLVLYVKSATVGVFDFVDVSKKMAVINILNDLIYPAFTKYLVGLYITFDIENKQIKVDIGRKTEAILKTIELDLPNVLEKNVLIRGTSTEVNKLTIIEDDEAHDFPLHHYYLHTDYTYDTDGSTNRMLPVINDMELVNMNTLTENGYWFANANVLYASDLIELDRALMNSEMGDISSGMLLTQNFIYTARGSGRFNQDYIDTTTGDRTAYYWLVDAAVYKVLDQLPGGQQYRYHWLSGETPDNNIWDDIENAGEGYFWYLAEVFSTAVHHTYHVLENKGNYDGYYHVTLNDAVPTTTGDHTSDPIDCVGWLDCSTHLVVKQDVKITMYATIIGNEGIPSKYELHYVTYSKVTREEYETGLDDYKQSSNYQQDLAAYKNAHLSEILSNYAGSVFGTSKYKNLIELTVEEDDALVDPWTIGAGRHLNIIHKGTSYHSILTGGSYMKGGLIKLVFGMIRIELTKLLNMKGV